MVVGLLSLKSLYAPCLVLPFFSYEHHFLHVILSAAKNLVAQEPMDFHMSTGIFVFDDILRCAQNDRPITSHH